MEIEIILKEYTYSSEKGKKLILTPASTKSIFLDIQEPEKLSPTRIQVDIRDLRLALDKIAL